MPPTLPNTLTNGTTADASQVMANFNAINAAVDQSTVTSLPGSPYDGQEIYYLADATNGVVWHLKYRAASASAYKWEYVGGSEMLSGVDTQETNTADNTWRALATAGPSVTVPLAGDYEVKIEGEMINGIVNGTTAMGYDVGATAASFTDAARHNEPTGAANSQTTVGRRRRKTALAASTALVAKYLSNGGGSNGLFGFRSMRVRPVRVG